MLERFQRRVNSEKDSKCERCGQNTQLSKSHAIPDAFFRALKRGGKGKITKIHQDFGVRPSSESGWFYILCAECEKHFSKACDQDAVLFSRNLVSGQAQQPVDHNTIALFICSVLWRAQLSSASTYAGYKITQADAEKISDAALQHCDPFIEFSFEVARLYDEKRIITTDQIVKTVAAPYKSEIKIGSKVHTIHYFVAMGIFFAALAPSVPSLVTDHRYLVRGGDYVPTIVRPLSSLSNFRKIEGVARREAALGR